MSDKPRRTTSSLDAAEAAFKKVTTKTPEPAPKAPSIPGAKEQVSLRIDRDILDYFQELGSRSNRHERSVPRSPGGNTVDRGPRPERHRITIQE